MKMAGCHTSEQKLRWLAAAILAIEPPRRIKGYRALPSLRQALLQEIQRATGTEGCAPGCVIS
jgi:hypothetical protein